MKADLHLHTLHSDGKFPPAIVIEKAYKKGIKIASITDHDNISAFIQAKEAAKVYKIELFSGVEISSNINGKELHILVYGFDPNCIELEKFLKKIRENRIRRIKKMISKLNDLGVVINENEFLNYYANYVAIGRPHLADALIKKESVKTYREAFQRYLGDGKPAFEPKNNPDYSIVFKLVKEIKALSFIAHPSKFFNNDELTTMVNAGLVGIEVIHPSHSLEDSKKYLQFARDNDLLICGGSDFHGMNNDDTNLGKFIINKSDTEKIKLYLNSL